MEKRMYRDMSRINSRKMMRGTKREKEFRDGLYFGKDMLCMSKGGYKCERVRAR